MEREASLSLCSLFPSIPPSELASSILLKPAKTKRSTTPDIKYATCQARLFFLLGKGMGSRYP